MTYYPTNHPSCIRGTSPQQGAPNRRTALIPNGQAHVDEYFTHELNEHIHFTAKALEEGPAPKLLFGHISGTPPRIPQFLTSICPIANACGQNNFTTMCAILGSISMALRGRYQVRVTPTWKEPLVDYWLMIGESGTHKSQLATLLRKPFDDFAASPPEKYLLQPDEVNKRKTQRKLANQQMARVCRTQLKGIPLDFSKDVVRAINSLSAEMVTFLDNFKLDLPAKVRLLFENGSIRKLARLMAEQGGCTSFLDAEGGIFSSRTFKDMDISLLLKAHSMEHYTHDPLNGEPCKITSAAIPMLILAQPSVIYGLLTNNEAVDRGLIARFLPVQINMQYILKDCTQSNLPLSDALSHYEKKIHSMLERNYTQNKDRYIYEIKTSTEATERLIIFENENKKYFRSNIARYTPKTPVINSFLRRLHGHAARIAGDLHAWQYDDPCATPISVDDAEHAIEIATHLLQSAEQTYDIEYQMDLFFAEKILSWIENWNSGDRFLCFDSRIAQQNIRDLNKHNATGALNLLCKNNYLKKITTPNTRTIYVANPQIFMRTIF